MNFHTYRNHVYSWHSADNRMSFQAMMTMTTTAADSDSELDSNDHDEDGQEQVC